MAKVSWDTRNVDEYKLAREKVLQLEELQCVGGQVVLSDKEKQVDSILMKYKVDELEEGYKNPSEFPPAVSFFKSKSKIEKSEVFKIIKTLPKGASLHCHDTGIASLDYVQSLMNTENLHGRITDGRLELKVFGDSEENKFQNWESMLHLRETRADFDSFLMSQLSIIENNPAEAYPDINSVWERFIQTFTTVNGVICYKPVFEEYFYQCLKELHEDNVKYLEFRGLLPPVYDENGVLYGQFHVTEMYYNVLQRFKSDYADFYGCKFIYSPLRSCDMQTFKEYKKTALQLKELFPDYIAGFDLVGQEDSGQSLRYFAPELFGLSQKMDCFFHAAETNWNGFETDINAIDALLFNTKRIGHGFGIVKHPEVLKILKERDIPVEICPISNQVLKLTEDLRNHPGSMLISSGYPVVICCDDPGMWGAKALSYDWYMAFMGMSRKNAGLKLLKQLAQNSIMYSSMSNEEKQTALASWVAEWDTFLTDFLKTYR